MNKKTMAAVFTAVVILAGCGKKEAVFENIQPKVVKSITAKSFEHEINTNFSGTVSAASETKLSFKVNGTVKKIYVKMGEKVTKGQILAEIAPEDYSIQYQTAENSLENAKIGINEAKARFEQAGNGYEQAGNSVEQSKTAVENARVQYASVLKKYERITKLYEDGNASVEDYENIKLARDSAKLGLDNANSMYEQAKTNVKNALAAIEQAKAGVNSAESSVKTVSKNVEMAKLQVDYTRLYAPADGIVVMKTAEENENIASGMPVLVINSGSNFEVKIFVPELIISNIKVGQKAAVKVDAIDGKVFSGTIKETGSASTGFGITFPVTIILNNNNISEKLRAGMTVEARLAMPANLKSRNVYIMPSAVGKDTAGNYVYIISGSGDKKVLKKRTVKTGEISSQGVEITGGIKEGEEVLAAGLRMAEEGMAVKVMEKNGEQK